MLMNCWYVAAEAKDITGTPKGVRMLGQDLVVFRDSAGTPYCLSDVCVHRGGSLCRGKVVNDAVECPYHGWRFNGAGDCVEIPSLGPDANIPKRARVDSYPVAEKYGWLWVFLGDAPEAERPPLPDYFPEYEAWEQGETDEWKFVKGTFTFEANWVRAIENGCDHTHAFYVHTDFGNPGQPTIDDYDLDIDEHKIESITYAKPVSKRGVWAEKIDDDRPDVKTMVRIYKPAPSIRIEMHLKPPMWQMIVSGYTPIDEHRTKVWWCHGRNFFTDDKYDADSHNRVLLVFQEDAKVIDFIRPAMVPPTLSDELALENDKHGIEFRKWVKEQELAGRALDLKTQQTADEMVKVIPSPKRREDPKNWVLEPVPMKRPIHSREAAE
ncbi:MAG: aromatic ring-hydroxylating dioxygenase subunit alpha [Rhodospirillaceae bacterium]